MKKIIEVRTKVNRPLLVLGILFLLLPLYGLYSGTAIHLGSRGHKGEAVPFLEDPDKYWFIINVEFIVVAAYLILSKIKFPFLDPFFEKLKKAQEEKINRPIWQKIMLYLVLPVTLVFGTLFLVVYLVRP